MRGKAAGSASEYINAQIRGCSFVKGGSISQLVAFQLTELGSRRTLKRWKIHVFRHVPHTYIGGGIVVYGVALVLLIKLLLLGLEKEAFACLI